MTDVFTMRATGGGVVRRIDAAEAKKAISLLADPSPGYGMEIRSLPGAQSVVLFGSDVGGLLEAARRAQEDDRCQVYYTLNPCKAPSSKATKDVDVIARRWLLIDVDPVRGPGGANQSATDGEKEAARAVAEGIRAELTALGWPLPLVVDSGNGFHLLYRIDLPNTQAVREWIKDFLYALAKKHDTPEVKIDKSVHNASRIAKLPGTWAMKGTHTEERPHRMARILFYPTALEDVGDLALQLYADPPPSTPAASPPPAVDAFAVHATNGDGGNDRAYARKALDGEVSRVALATPGDQGGEGRNCALNTAAFNMGQLVAGGMILRQEVESALTMAANQAGLDTDPNCGPRGIARTIKSGLDAGGTKPRKPKEKPTEGGATPQATAAPSAARSTRPEIHRMTDVMAMKLPPPVWAVPGIMSEGLSILAGKPKLGKSWMALNLALTIAAGGTALGSVKVEAGDVLYLSLEDRLRRVQDRTQKLLKGIDCDVSERLHVAVAWPKQNDSGLGYMAEWLSGVERPRLVIVDVWQKFRPALKQGSQYEQDYLAASDLKSLGDRYGCSILILHHCKKAAADDVVDEISGTLGLAGAADGLLVLTRARSEREGKLFVSGRDVEEQEMALEFDPATFAWKCLGDAKGREMGKVKAAVLELFKKSGAGASYWPSEVAKLLELIPNSVKSAMWRMADDGLLKRKGDKYTWPADERPAGATPF